MMRQNSLLVQGAFCLKISDDGQGVKPSDVGFIHGTDVVAIEPLQSRVVLFGVGHGSVLQSPIHRRPPDLSIRAISVGPSPSTLSCFTRAVSIDALRPL